VPTSKKNPVVSEQQVAAQSNVAGINYGGEIRFFMDDQNTNNLIQNVGVPTSPPDPPFSVQNYVGHHPDNNSPQAMAANCHVTLLSGQAMVRKYLGYMPKWAAVPSIRVYPQAGTQLNAFYNRVSLQFFSGTNPVTGAVVHTCLSNDTITHEFFHAVLDALKPQLYSSPLIEQSAVHEAVADCGSILHALTMDPTLTFVAQQLDQSSVSTLASSVGPELGHALNRVVGGLRDASVPFYYTAPENLPAVAPRDQLSRQFHNFSRIFSSAFYAAIMAVYHKVKSPGGIGTREALIVARDVMGVALFQAIKIAPVTAQYMTSLANAILTAMSDSPYLAEVATVFGTWRLTTVASQSVSRTEIQPTDVSVSDDGRLLIRSRTKTIILGEEVVLPSSDNPLYFCKVEVPREELLSAQSLGMAQVLDAATDAEILDQVKLGLDYIWEQDLVTLDGQPKKDHHLYKVDVNGFLLRDGYNSEGYFNNATLPGAPEFGKPWKAANNSGCCSGCKKTPDPVVPPPKLGCYVQERVCGSRTVRSCQVVRQKVC
jgi:hypothetical protein